MSWVIFYLVRFLRIKKLEFVVKEKIWESKPNEKSQNNQLFGQKALSGNSLFLCVVYLKTFTIWQNLCDLLK